MKILEGGLPEHKTWRALILLSPGDALGVAWQLALGLARANHGEVVAAVILRQSNEAEVAKARETLAHTRHSGDPDGPVYTLLIEAPDYRQAIRELVQQGDIDLVLTAAATPGRRSFERVPTAVAAVRGEAYHVPRKDDESSDTKKAHIGLGNILVPTSGGPNTVHALSLLLPLTDAGTTVTALYIAPEYLGSNAEALGRSRLRQTLEFIDASGRIESKLITAKSVIEGIVGEASADYDAIIIGASRESSFDRALFGDIPAAVVRECRKPVVVLREPHRRVGGVFRDLSWAMQNIVPRLSLGARTEAYVRIRRSARPDTDFFVLIGLSTAIAALGLLLNSPAVVIGAMLVAPLMSPIAGTGLAIVLGDTRFLRLTLGAVFRGALLTLFVGLLAGLLQANGTLPPEVSARAEPTLLDLGVALFSGMAVAYALCRSEAAAALPGVAIAAALVPPLASAGVAFSSGHLRQGLGALLLFSTNYVAISSAAALIFIVLGFRPTRSQKERQVVQRRSVRIALILLAIITAVLAAATYRLAQESAIDAEIRRLAADGVAEFVNAELAEVEIGNLNDPTLQLGITVHSTRSVPHAAVVELQRFIATELQREIALNLTVIPSTKLDPFVPPTFTPTPLPTDTPTSGPTPTRTLAPTSTPSPTPTATATATATTLPSPTPTATPADTAIPTVTPSPTPPRASVVYPYGLNLRQEPSASSPLLDFLPLGTVVVVLEGREANGQAVWQQVETEGQVGWVLAEFLERLAG